jgi:hypothetical protein
MKKTMIAVVLSLALVALVAAPLMAAAQKANLVPCPINYPNPAALPPGGGFVVFNNSAGPNNLEMTVALKGVMPNTEYDIYLGVDVWGTPGKVGTVTTNAQGNANFHLNTAVGAPGTHALNVDVTLKGSGADIYELPGIHDSPMGGVTMIFK